MVYMDIYARILHVYIFLGGEIFWEDGIWLDFNGFDQLSNEFPWLKQLQASSSTSRVERDVGSFAAGCLDEHRLESNGSRLSIRTTLFFSPHLCVGFLFLILYPAASPPLVLLLLLRRLLFTHHLSFTQQFVTHHLSHTTLSPTIFHTQLCTHNFVTPSLSSTIFHTQLCHPPS